MAQAGAEASCSSRCTDSSSTSAKKAADDVLDLAETLGAEQDRLVVGDVVGLHAHPRDVQRPQVRLRDLLDLSVRREQPGAVAADLASSRTTPNSRENQNTFEMNSSASLGLHPAYRVPGRPVQRGEPVVGQAVAVTEHLVQHVGLGGVERDRVVPDVLGGVEDPVGQRPVELGQLDQPGRGHVLEAGERSRAAR